MSVPPAISCHCSTVHGRRNIHARASTAYSIRSQREKPNKSKAVSSSITLSFSFSLLLSPSLLFSSLRKLGNHLPDDHCDQSQDDKVQKQQLRHHLALELLQVQPRFGRVFPRCIHLQSTQPHTDTQTHIMSLLLPVQPPPSQKTSSRTFVRTLMSCSRWSARFVVTFCAVASVRAIRSPVLSDCPTRLTRALLACYTCCCTAHLFVRHASPLSVIIAAVLSNAFGCHSFTFPLHSFPSYTRNSQPG